MRTDGLLGVAIPTDLGGEGWPLHDIAGAVQAIARHCSSSAMTLAMHQIQVACLARHGHGDHFRDRLRQIARDQLLLASATTEATVGGDTRSSICAVERTAAGYHLEKQASVISYGEYADAVLVTARRDASSPPSDQVLVYCEPPGLHLDASGTWDTLGFRGTVSHGFQLVADGSTDDILPDSFGDISTATMLPVSHILWGSVWLGMAEAAADKAHRYLRDKARSRPGSAPASAAVSLAELAGELQQFRALMAAALLASARADGDPESVGSISTAVAMNSLKVAASTLVVSVTAKALMICGMAGYREDSPFSLGRLLRDAYGAQLMVNNDRILSNTAQLLLASKRI